MILDAWGVELERAHFFMFQFCLYAVCENTPVIHTVVSTSELQFQFADLFWKTSEHNSEVFTS